jgi:hypothetical protein
MPTPREIASSRRLATSALSIVFSPAMKLVQFRL